VIFVLPRGSVSPARMRMIPIMDLSSVFLVSNRGFEMFV